MEIQIKHKQGGYSGLHITDTNVNIEEDLDYIKDYNQFIDIGFDIFNYHSKGETEISIIKDLVRYKLNDNERDELMEFLKTDYDLK